LAFDDWTIATTNLSVLVEPPCVDLPPVPAVPDEVLLDFAPAELPALAEEEEELDPPPPLLLELLELLALLELLELLDPPLDDWPPPPLPVLSVCPPPPPDDFPLLQAKFCPAMKPMSARVREACFETMVRTSIRQVFVCGCRDSATSVL
jgi:hypothetical protein